MIQNQVLSGKFSHRAVAPIIATLLMVAIAVVGGILIFVFTQGFFTDTQLSSAPAIEVIDIFGYDTRDTATLDAHTGADIVVSSAANSKLDDNDGFVIYVRNRGTAAVTFAQVKVYGDTYPLATLAACTAAVPASRSFLMITDLGDGDSTDAVVIGDCANAAILQPSEEGSIVVRYEEDTNGEIKIGRPISVQVVTGNGGVFSKQLQNGIRL